MHVKITKKSLLQTERKYITRNQLLALNCHTMRESEIRVFDVSYETLSKRGDYAWFEERCDFDARERNQRGELSNS